MRRGISRETLRSRVFGRLKLHDNAGETCASVS
jgi:hypothetical protein